MMKKYTVHKTHCNCHPETCCCFEWEVITPSGDPHSGYFYRYVAQEVADALNFKLVHDVQGDK